MSIQSNASGQIGLSRDQVLAVVKQIVGEQMDIAPEQIQETDDLFNDLGCDSLDVVEITMEVEDHFDIAYELEDTLERRGKHEALDALKAELPAAGMTSFTRQQAPLGLGHAVWCARDIVGDEPFALLLPDIELGFQQR